MAKIKTVTAAEALGLGWLGAKAIIAALGCAKQTFSRYVTDFPAPAGRIKPDSGRPENAWLVSTLPETIAVKGKAVAVRGPAEKALHAALDNLAALADRALKQAEVERRLALVEAAPTTSSTAVATTTPAVELTANVIKKGGQVRRARKDDELTEKQRAARDGAIILCRAIDEGEMETGHSVKTVCVELAERLLNGTAYDHLKKALIASQTKPRKAGPTYNGLLRHLQRLHGLYLEGIREGDPCKYLVPGQREKEGHDPIHVHAFLLFWCDPNRPGVSAVHRKMVPYLESQGLKAPSYSTACKIEESLPVTVKYRGRMTGSAFRALLPYVNRDVSMFKANDIWVGDGHSFKAKIQSPLHGNAFIPEVTVILDWVSRRVVGYSVALSESTIAVSDAFRHAQMQTLARPLIYYSDNGSGQTGKHIDHEVTGTLARQGIAHETGIPGNPQGRGIIERWWPTVLLPLAESYPTFTGKKADKETVRKMSNELARAQRAGEASPLLPSFRQFLIDLDEAIERYNSSHRHSELNGMTPNEAYAAKLDPDSIGAVTDEELDCLWMPEEIRTPARGLIQLFNNTYFMPSLIDDLADGEQVRVRFDIHDAATVHVLRMNGSKLGIAEWDGNKRAAFPVPYVEQKREERAIGIKGRAQAQIDRADAELQDTYTVAALPEPQAPAIDLTVQLGGTERSPAEVLPGPPEAEIARNRRINQMEDPALVRWLATHPEDINPDRARYLIEQAEKIEPLARLISELAMWNPLEAAGSQAEIQNFENRAVASAN